MINEEFLIKNIKKKKIDTEQVYTPDKEDQNEEILDGEHQAEEEEKIYFNPKKTKKGEEENKKNMKKSLMENIKQKKKRQSTLTEEQLKMQIGAI